MFTCSRYLIFLILWLIFMFVIVENIIYIIFTFGNLVFFCDLTYSQFKKKKKCFMCTWKVHCVWFKFKLICLPYWLGQLVHRYFFFHLIYHWQRWISAIFICVSFCISVFYIIFWYYLVHKYSWLLDLFCGF